ncbi:MAG TPA: SGNH/GDSL hydrolase family protein [Nocardiopsis listeri]|uniref:SGNH/GDSL hydrolase family protein n=1 Tax=Nocardiopsis listeri TaxID=53440 RepID=UPI001DDF92FB|nr:SGNH/GDSL hydrolase family protein [Nocardiopsis listeri]HJE59146.1 SGNH/GDSL hydrolase family protein [Nocardiopsis listeri]
MSVSRALAAVSGLAFIPLIFAAPVSAEVADINYVALGDSFSSGLGTADYDDDGCKRGPAAYPELWAASNAPAAFDFVACSGATTDDVLNDQVSALSPETNLVTITIGGNDVGFADVITTCRLGSNADCDEVGEQAENEVRDVLPGLLDQTYGAITEAAPQAQVVVLGYPSLFELGPCGVGSIGEVKRERLNQMADVLSDTIADRATSAGLTHVDVNGTFEGHRVCADEPWINGTKVPISESYHPNASGHSEGYLPAMAGAIG